MTTQVAVGVYLLVHVLSAYVLRASGTWQVLFAPLRNLAPDTTPDPLRVAPRGWIENHSFWDLGSEADPADNADPATEFWGTAQRDVG